jgi:FkbM family methyltransferase
VYHAYALHKGTNVVSPKVLAFDPSPANIAIMREQAEKEAWSDFVPVQAAVAGKESVLVLEGAQLENTVQSLRIDDLRLDASGSNAAGTTQSVPVMTLDKVFADLLGPSERVYFLKVDVEGHDVPLLMNSDVLMRPNSSARHPNLILFEHNNHAAHKDLPQLITKLGAVGYLCFYCTPTALYPASFQWWDDMYLTMQHGNFLCGLRDSHGRHRESSLTQIFRNFHSNVGGLPKLAAKLVRDTHLSLDYLILPPPQDPSPFWDFFDFYMKPDCTGNSCWDEGGLRPER